MQLIRKIVIAFLVITVFASSNYILNDNADYHKASAATGVEEFVSFSSANVDSRYTYYVRSTNSADFAGYNAGGGSVWTYTGSFAQVPTDKGIVRISNTGSSGWSQYVITRRINDTNDPSYNSINILEFVNFHSHIGLDFSKYSYHILATSASVDFRGSNLSGSQVWSVNDTAGIQVPEDKGIYSIAYGGFSGWPSFVIVRKSKVPINKPPTLNILTPNNQVLS